MNYSVYFQKAKDQGIDELELSITSTKKLSIDVFRGEIESFSSSLTKALQARGKIGNKVGYVNSENFDRKKVDELIGQIKENAENNNSKDECIIFKGSEKYTKKIVFNKKLEETSVDDKIALLKEIEHKAKSKDSRIKDVTVSYQEEQSEKVLENSYGLKLKDKSNYFMIYCSVVCGDENETKNGGDYILGNDLSICNVDDFVDRVCADALDQLGGEPCDSKKYKAVFNPSVTISLLNFFVHNTIAEEVQKNTSLLKDKLNQLVTSKKITIEERPLDRGIFFRYFDDEGVATYNKKIIDKGILKTYLYNLATAKKDGCASTGNGYRGSGKVGTSTSSLTIRPGKKSLDELFAKVGNGIYITYVAGLHAGMNAQSGNFSLQANGYLIENGKKTKPVCLITIAGNLFEVFKNVIEVGNDVKTTFQGFCPSVVVKSISVSGK